MSAAGVEAVDVGVVRQVLQTRAGELVALTVIRGRGGADARPFLLDSPASVEAAVRFVAEQASTDQTVSVGVATLSAAGAARLAEQNRRKVRARPRSGEHDGYAWVVADLDPHDGEDRAALHARLGAYPHPPTLLASSGRGLHAWWRLTEPVDVDAGRLVCQDLARALGGDPGAGDEGRALRLPGTFNGKPGVRRLAAVLELDPDRRYAAAALSEAACALVPRPPVAVPRPRRVIELRDDLDVAEQLRAAHHLPEELDRIAGPGRLGKWRCPAGHDGTASLGLHRDEEQRWVCFGGSHPDGVGRRTPGGQYSGDVVDLLALEAGQTVEQFLSAERARLRPRPTSSPAPGGRTSPGAGDPPQESTPAAGREGTERGAAPTNPTREGAAPRRNGEPSQADQLVRLALTGYTLGRSRTEPFAVPHNGPRTALALRGGGNSLRQHLAVAYARAERKTASAGALADALNTLEGYANETDPVSVDLRLSHRVEAAGEQVVIDLGDASGRAVVVDPTGWRVVDRSPAPVIFRRTALTMPLPEPVRGGTLEELRDLLNVTDETWPLLVGWLVASLIPDLPHPIALLSGEQGTGKSTAARLLVQLVDPSAAPLRSSPKDEETWGVSAAASYVVGIDNISTIPPWLSDAWCRAVTGDGLVRRRLYTDSDVSVLSLQRVLVLTSIDAGAMRGDLAERLLTVELARIDPKQRRTDRELHEAWVQAHPRLLGALLDLLVGVLAALPAAAADLAEHPRMADFAEVLLAADRVRQTASLDSYRRMGERLARDVAESDPVAHAVLALLEKQAAGWYGKSTDLLHALRPYAPDPLPRAWPPDASRLTTYLLRVAPSLRASGVDVATHRRASAREVQLTKLGQLALDESA